MMSRAPRPTIPSSGSAQNGWIMLVQASPQAMAMAVTVGETPRACAAGSMIGPCTAHWPPPEGTNTLTTPALRKASSGKVSAEDQEMNASVICRPSEMPSALAPIIMPMMPA